MHTYVYCGYTYVHTYRAILLRARACMALERYHDAVDDLEHLLPRAQFAYRHEVISS